MSLVHHIVSVVTSVILSSIQHAEAEANVQKSVLKSVFYITECTTFDNIKTNIMPIARCVKLRYSLGQECQRHQDAC